MIHYYSSRKKIKTIFNPEIFGGKNSHASKFNFEFDAVLLSHTFQKLDECSFVTFKETVKYTF